MPYDLGHTRCINWPESTYTSWGSPQRRIPGGSKRRRSRGVADISSSPNRHPRCGPFDDCVGVVAGRRIRWCSSTKRPAGDRTWGGRRRADGSWRWAVTWSTSRLVLSRNSSRFTPHVRVCKHCVVAVVGAECAWVSFSKRYWSHARAPPLRVASHSRAALHCFQFPWDITL